MFRLFWRFVGAPMDRVGGPWWCRDFETEGAALSHSGVFHSLVAEVRLQEGELAAVDPMNIYPSDDAIIVWDGEKRVYVSEET